MDQERMRAAQGAFGTDADLFCRVWERVGAQERPECPIETDGEKRSVPPGRRTEPEVRTEGTETAADDFPVPEDIPCLGRASVTQSGPLQQYIREELEGWQLYRQLARRIGGPHARTLTALAAEKLRCARRLAAVHFLIGGVRYWPADRLEVPRPGSWLGVLRERFGAEQRREHHYRAAACDTTDPCLRTLYCELAEECAAHGAALRAILETAL